MAGWIGVDLDGTLAVQIPGRVDPGLIGAPVPHMLARVQRWLSQGKDVRIFTARAYTDGSNARNFRAQQAKHAIDSWCMHYLGRTLPITSQKDFDLVEFWDDRAVQVIPNTGIRADGGIE